MVAPGVPAALEAVCLTAMERAPADRYGSAAELAREVERWMAGEHVRTNYVEPRAARLARWLRSRYGLLTLVGLLGASLICLAVAIGVIHREREYAREDGQRLNETIRDKAAEINRQRGLASEEFGAATHTLRELARQAQGRPGGDQTLAAFRAEVLRRAYEGARRMSAYADQAAGTDLAAAHDRISLGELFEALERLEEARHQYERAVDITEAIMKAQPDSLDAKVGLFQAARGLGRVQFALHNPADARRSAHTALAAIEHQARADPTNAALGREVAACHELIAAASVELHDLSTARDAFGQMAAVVESYARADSPNLPDRFDLANTYIACGNLERLDHRVEEAMAWYDKALAILRRLRAEGKLARFPAEADRLDKLEKNAGESRDILKAIEDINFALDQRGDETLRLLMGRAGALARRGRPGDAAATAEKMRALKPEDPVNLYNVACCYALCVPAVGAGQAADALPAEEKAARAEYIARALKELRAAAGHGFHSVEKIESDPDLDALHKEADYRALVAELKALRVWVTLPVLP
jgi:tetratricopeptide (TPR) repeat protein